MVTKKIQASIVATIIMLALGLSVYISYLMLV
jgi:hypothetical protein